MGSGDLRAVDWPKAGPWFALAAAVFLLNDLAFLNVTGYRPWLLVDYGLRVLVLVILLVPAAPRAVARAGVGGGMRSMVIVAALGAAFVYGTSRLAEESWTYLSAATLSLSARTARRSVSISSPSPPG